MHPEHDSLVVIKNLKSTTTPTAKMVSNNDRQHRQPVMSRSYSQRHHQVTIGCWTTAAATLMIVVWMSTQLVECASLSSNFDLLQLKEQKLIASKSSTTPQTLSMCTTSNDASKQFVHEHEVRSSMTLDLNPGQTMSAPCKTVLTAPESNVFIVRLHRINVVARGLSSSASGSGSARGSRNLDTPMDGIAGRNTTRSCPLSIISTSDPLKSPWKIDPCLLSDTADDPVQMLPGRLKIIWHHNGNSPNYRLIVTAMGKGHNCVEPNRHACLRFGTEIMLCISDALVCDGIRHCPNGNGYEDDEDPKMCMQFKSSPPQHIAEMGLWQQISKELKKILPSTESSESIVDADVLVPVDPETTIGPKTSTHKPSTAKDRASLTRGLSRYGPWGYLMLGMLLCGGALLLCGLWECCCRSKKPETTENGDPIVSTLSAGAIAAANASATEPPNYDEIDPPPSYAALFPNQKSETSSSTSSGQRNTANGTATPPSTMSTTTATPLTTTTTITAAIAAVSSSSNPTN